jgi:VWFA-related protein
MLRLRIRLAPTLALATTLLAAFVSAVRPASAQVPANTNASNLPATQLKVTTNLVVVRVVVRDAQGKPVKGLRKEDFKLFDSGKEQSIAQFEVEAAAESPLPPVNAHRPEQGRATLSSSLPERFLALYFDDMYTSDNDMVQVRKAADDYLAANLQPADRVAIFTSGAMLSDFTSDPKQMHEALSKLRASGRAPALGHDCPDLSDYQALEMTRTRAPEPLSGPPEPIIALNNAWGLAYQEIVARNCVPSFHPLAVKNFLLGQALKVAGQAEVLTHSNLRELEEVVKYTAQMPGQRTVIFGSPGFLLQDDNQFQLERIIDQALHLQVVISSLDPRGLAVIARQGDASLLYNPASSGTASGAVHRMDQNREVLAGDVMAQVAEGTGGEYFHNNNDMKAGFGRLAGSPGAYILAFAPKDLKLDGKLHPLKVKLAETGYRIQARRSYFAPRNEAEAKAEAKEVVASSAADQMQVQVQEQIREALVSKTDVAQFPIVMDTTISAGQGETRELSLSSHVDPKSLHFQREADHNLNTLTFVFGVFDQKDNLVIAQQRHATVDVADGQLPELLRAGINVGMAFQLKPGSYRIREVVTDSEQLTTLSRNVDIPVIIPTTPAAAAAPPHPPQAPAPQPTVQPNPQPAQPSQTPMQQPAAVASSLPPSLPSQTSPRAPPLQAPIQQAVTRSASDSATDELVLRVWDNYVEYLSSIPNVFADEHVVSSLTTASYNSPSKQGVHDSEMTSTVDSTTDSIFRLKRFSADGKTTDLIESREVKYVNGHAAAKDQSLTGPAILIGAFSRAPNILSPELKDCYDYRLLPSMRHKPGEALLFLHANVLVLEYALKSPLPTGAQCPVSEQTIGRAFIDPSSMQIVRLEQQRPRHDEGSGRPVAWSWSIDYARVIMDGKHFWLPKTISSKSSSLDGGRFKWSFLATYGNYHLMTVTSTILPAANTSQH